jgi:hypothetical protein
MVWIMPIHSLHRRSPFPSPSRPRFLEAPEWMKRSCAVFASQKRWQSEAVVALMAESLDRHLQVRRREASRHLDTQRTQHGIRTRTRSNTVLKRLLARVVAQLPTAAVVHHRSQQLHGPALARRLLNHKSRCSRLQKFERGLQEVQSQYRG